MSTLTSDGPRLSTTLVASAIATTASGEMDAWVYLAHGYALANAQTGNVVLMALATGFFPN